MGEYSNLGIFFLRGKKKKTDQRTQKRRIHQKKSVIADYEVLPPKQECGQGTHVVGEPAPGGTKWGLSQAALLMTGCVKLGFTQTPHSHHRAPQALALGSQLIPGKSPAIV